MRQNSRAGVERKALSFLFVGVNSTLQSVTFKTS